MKLLKSAKKKTPKKEGEKAVKIGPMDKYLVKKVRNLEQSKEDKTVIDGEKNRSNTDDSVIITQNSSPKKCQSEVFGHESKSEQLNEKDNDPLKSDKIELDKLAKDDRLIFIDSGFFDENYFEEEYFVNFSHNNAASKSDPTTNEKVTLKADQENEQKLTGAIPSKRKSITSNTVQLNLCLSLNLEVNPDEDSRPMKKIALRLSIT